MTTAPSRLRPALLALALLAGCLYPPRSGGGGFEALAVAEQGMFRRCKQPLAQHLCAGADEAAQARCLQTQALTYARRSDKMRRRWLELNQCPAAVIDGPEPATAAVEPRSEEARVATAAPAPAPEAAPAPAVAAAPVPALLPSGAACQRSAACESDLCVRGVCVALAMIEIGKPVQAQPARVAVAAAGPSPAAVVAEEDSTPDEPEPAPAEQPAPPAEEVRKPAAPIGKVTEPAKKPAEPVVAAVERLPPGPRMSNGNSAADQLRGAIVQHEAEMKRCVERQLKLVPDLRAEGTLVLEINASGRVTQAALRGERLQGTPLENCMRAIAARWVFPRTARAYAVEAPLKVSGVEDRRN
jgi:hypothetical protein